MSVTVSLFNGSDALSLCLTDRFNNGCAHQRLTKYCARKHVSDCLVLKCKICKHWREYMRNKHKLCSSMIKKYPNNFAFLCMYGFQLYQQKKYHKCIIILWKAHKLWKYPLLLCIIGICFEVLHKYLESIEIYEGLSDDSSNDWTFITDCISDAWGTNQSQKTICHSLFRCYSAMLQTKSVSKTTKAVCLQKAIKIKEYIFAHGLYKWFHSHPLLGRPIADIIKLCYWHNYYDKAIEYILKCIDLYPKYKYVLPPTHECNLLLLNMGKLEIWQKYFIPQINNYNITRNKKDPILPHGFFTDSFMISMGMVTDVNLVVNQIKLLSEKSKLFCYSDLLCFNGNSENINAWFIDCGVNLIKFGTFDKACNGEYYKGNHGGYGLWNFQFYYFYAKYMYFKLRNFKIARCLYRMALKINSGDVVCNVDMAMLMRDSLKYKLALKYLYRAKRFNEKIYYINGGEEIRTEIELMQHNKNSIGYKCNWCNKSTKASKKCSRCRIVFYCSRLHQKLDWKDNHRYSCKHNTKESIKDVLYEYFMNNTHIDDSK